MASWKCQCGRCQPGEQGAVPSQWHPHFIAVSITTVVLLLQDPDQLNSMEADSGTNINSLAASGQELYLSRAGVGGGRHLPSPLRRALVL